MKLALVADWLPGTGGAGQVIKQISACWPDAPLYTTLASQDDMDMLQETELRLSPLQKWYRILRNHQVLLPWMPRTLEQIDLREFDVIISSSHAVAKGIVPPSSAKHICYCHTPMRYAWEMEEEYIRDFRVPRFAQNAVRTALRRLRRWDLTTAKRVDTFVANSRTTQERISRVYNRDSMIIHPPVDDRYFTDHIAQMAQSATNDYYLAIGRMVPYKRFDLLVQAANRLKLPLKIAGTGQQMPYLKQIAGDTVEFLGFVPDADLSGLYANAKALLFPQFEDAGVVPVEAQACGTPVIAYAKGGALETIADGTTGLFFAEQTVDSLADALERFQALQVDPSALQEHASQYSAERFREQIRSLV